MEESHSKTHYFCYEEMQIEDDDGLLVENGTQHELDIDDDEMILTDMKYDCIDETTPS